MITNNPLKQYLLFIYVLFPHSYMGWKYYITPERAIQAFKDLRKHNWAEYKIGKTAKIINFETGHITIYEIGEHYNGKLS